MYRSILLLPFLSLPCFSSVGDWPTWLGPDRDGISRETEWSSVPAPEPLWKREVGFGYSNVSIVGDRLLTLGFEAKGEEGAGEDVLFCLHPRTGEVLWTRRWPAEILANFHGGGTLTTPTIHGELVYVTGRFGQARCLRLDDGSPVWERDYKAELELPDAMHGYPGSPLILDGDLILAVGGTLVRAKLEDGGILWNSQEFGGGYSTPAPFELHGRASLAFFAGAGLLVVDLETGEERHRHPWRSTQGGVNAATPIPIGENILISSAYGMGTALLGFGDAPEAEEIWATKRLRNKVSGLVLHEEHVYGFDESMLKCLDLEGNEKWRVRGLGMGALSMAGDRLLVLNSKGELIVAPASPDGFEELYRERIFESDGVSWTNPVLVDGLVYCRNSLGELLCLDHREDRSAMAIDSEAPAAPATLPPGEDLLARHLAAIGGAEAWSEVTGMTLEGTIEITGAGITRTPVRIERSAPDRWFLEYSLGQYGVVQRAHDGEVAWVLDPFYGDEILEGRRLRELRDDVRLDRDRAGAQGYASVATQRRGMFADRDCWAVDVVTSDGDERTLWFEAETGLLAGRDADEESRVVYAEYRAFEGRSVPARITYLIPDTGAEETVRIDAVRFGEVDESVFEQPEKVRLMLMTPEEIALVDAAARAQYAPVLGFYQGAAPEPPEEGPAPSFEFVIQRGTLFVVVGDGREFEVAEGDEEGRWELAPEVYFEFEREGEESAHCLRLHSRGRVIEAARAERPQDD